MLLQEPRLFRPRDKPERRDDGDEQRDRPFDDEQVLPAVQASINVEHAVGYQAAKCAGDGI